MERANEIRTREKMGRGRDGRGKEEWEGINNLV